MNALLAEILRTGTVQAPDGRTLPLQSHVLADEAEFLERVVREARPTTTLEVGLAMGCSALAIGEATRDVPGAHHIVIDPRQNAQPLWGGIGLHHLERAGFRARTTFLELPSHRALAQLENEGRRIQFAFIDGFHTFDYALVDFFLIDRLLDVGGLVAFDDADWPSVRRAVRYVATNRAYTVHAAMPPRRDRWSLARRGYEGARALAGGVLGAASRLPGVGRAVAGVFSPEWCGVDARLGLGGPCVVLRKTANDARRYDHHVDF
jgi:predicted O-methyltransferase YrrM